MVELWFMWCVGLCVHISTALTIHPEDKFSQQLCKKGNYSCGYHSSSDDPLLYTNIPQEQMPNVDQTNFFNFMRKNFRKYPAGSKIFQEKWQIFMKSLKRHKYLNTPEISSNATSSAYYGVNQFSDLSVEEFKNIYLKSYRTRPYHYLKPVKTSTVEISLPLRFDWGDKKVVTPVRNQMSCGACWAFSVVGAVESAYAIKGHSLEELSVQQVIDCSYLDSGCNGGSTISALKWLIKTQAKLVRTNEYTFKAQTGMCHYFPTTEFGVSIKGFEAYDFSISEQDMMVLLIKHGPLIAIVDAVSWQDYLGGIIQHHCSSGEANHAVLVTGFDRTGDTPFWIVKNSWGTSWGRDGYVYIKIGGNICGIADSVSVPLV